MSPFKETPIFLCYLACKLQHLAPGNFCQNCSKLPEKKKRYMIDNFLHWGEMRCFSVFSMLILYPWEPTSFIFRGYIPYIGGVKPSFFMVLGSKGFGINQPVYNQVTQQIEKRAPQPKSSTFATSCGTGVT